MYKTMKVLGLEPRTLCLKDKYSTIELYFLRLNNLKILSPPERRGELPSESTWARTKNSLFKIKYSTIELYFYITILLKNIKRVYIGIEYIPCLLANKDLIKLCDHISDANIVDNFIK